MLGTKLIALYLIEVGIYYGEELVFHSTPLMRLWIGIFRVCRLELELDQLLELSLLPMKVLN